MSWQSEKAHGEEIAYQLAPLGNVTVVRFFSGAAMRLDGVMFGFMSRGSLFLRVDDVNRPAFVAAGMGPFSYERPTRTVSLDGYYETPADVLEDAGALFDWCRWDEQEQGACVAGLSDFQNQGPHQRRSNLASLVRVRAVGDSASLRPCKREAA